MHCNEALATQQMGGQNSHRADIPPASPAGKPGCSVLAPGSPTLLSKPFFVLGWPEPSSITPVLSWVLVGDGARARQLCRLQRVGEGYSACSQERGAGKARPDPMGPAGTAWGMDVSGPCGGAGSSPAPWMAGDWPGPVAQSTLTSTPCKASGARRPVRASHWAASPKPSPKSSPKCREAGGHSTHSEHPPSTLPRS